MVSNNSITINYSTVPQTSFINLFPEIVYDPTQAAADSLDIWSSAEINVFPKNTLANPYIVYDQMLMTIYQISQEYFMVRIDCGGSLYLLTMWKIHSHIFKMLR